MPDLIYRSNDSEVVLPVITLIYLALMFLIFWRVKSGGCKMIGLGIVTAVFGVWCRAMGIHFLGVQVQPDHAALTVGADGADTLARIAVLLVLGGLAVTILGTPVTPMEADRAKPE